MVALRDDLNSCAPRLRRFARALITGHPAPHKIADDLVRAMLPRALETGPSCGRRGADLHLHLYALLIEGNRERVTAEGLGIKAHMELENFYAGGTRAGGTLPLSAASPGGKLADALMALSLEDREALLLVALEGFTHAQASRILRISRAVLLARLARARAALGDILPAEFVAYPTKAPVKALPAYLRVVK
jgi:RNA polymerase sigma-70 factor (ECF subfamily)